MNKYLLFLLIFLPGFIIAQSLIKPEEITIEDGLSQGFVSEMIQDKEGFLWFGTINGLNRYDGEHFQIFVHDPIDPYSISGDFIRSIYDEGDYLLIGTHRNGLCIYHKQSRRFYSLPNFILGYGEDEDVSTESIVKDKLGQFWFRDGINRKLVRIQFPDDFWELLPSDETIIDQIITTSLPLNDVHFIKKSYNSNKVIVSSGYLTLRLWEVDIRSMDQKDISPDPSSDAMTIVKYLPIDEEQIIVNENNRSSEDGNSRIWNLKKNTWQSINKGSMRYDFLMNPSFFGFSTRDNEWIIFERSNVSLSSFDQNDAFFRYKKDAFNIESTLVDRSGNLWLGTNGYGVLKITPRKSKIATYGDFYFGNIPHLSTTGEVLVDLDLNDKLKTFYHPEKQLNFKKNGLLDFYKTYYGARSWIGKDGVIWATGIDSKGEHQVFRIPNGGMVPSDALFTASIEVTAFAMDDENNLVLFAYPDGLVSYNRQTGKIIKSFFPTSIKSKYQMLSMTKTQDGRWWIGTQGGLIECVLSEEGFDFKLLKGNKNKTLNQDGISIDLLNNSVASLLTDPEDPNILWVGTKGGGLHRLDTKTMDITHLTSKNGLPNDVIYGVLNDDNGNLWMSSNKGIIRYNPKTGRISNFTVADGMQSNEFNTWSYAKGPKGEMMFGGIKGLNVFHPDDFKDVEEVPDVVITGLSINNENIYVNDSTDILHSAIEYADQINLTFAQNSFSLQFAGLEYSTPAKNKYKYYLEGAENAWAHESTKNEVNYLNLFPGSYVFKIKGSNGDEVWSTHITALKIIVSPPWYRSNLAYFVYLGLVGFGIWYFLRLQKKRIQLEYRVESEQEEAKRLKELDQVKSRLYTNITHEFRTPLTVISGLANQLPDKIDSKEIIKRNCDQLLNLVNQMLDLRKIESGEIAIHKTQGNVVKYLRYLTDSLNDFAEMSHGVKLHFLCELDSLIMDFDAEIITRIHSNLMSNAIKFTPKGGNVYVQLSVEKNEIDQQLLMKIKDTGVGISADNLTHIFDRFYQVDDSSTRKGEGTGIGLTLVSELIKALKGTINVSSTIGEGTTFVIALPITNLAEKERNTLDVKPSNIAMVDVISGTTISALTKKVRANDQSKPLALIIEDNADVLHYLINCLKNQYAIEIAMNGEEGIEKALDIIPDIIVSDVMMPIKDGFEVCQTLKNDERTSHIPIILLTAKADMDSRLEGLQRGADAYLNKPFHQEELLITLKNQLVLRKVLQSRLSNYAIKSPAVIEQVIFQKKEVKIHLEIENAFLKKISDFIKNDLSNSEVGIDQLVQQIGMSRSQIYRKVKALTDRSPSQYIRSIRLNRAKELIEKGEMNITEIANKVGFSTLTYFSSVYFEEFGYRPKKGQV